MPNLSFQKNNFFYSVVAGLLILSLPQLANSQNAKSWNGYGLEVGGGYSQILYSTPQDIEIDNRTSFSIFPTARVVYGVDLFNNIGLLTFMGYNEIGGRLNTKIRESFNSEGSDGYTVLKYRAAEIGAIVLAPVSSLRFGLGFKIQRLISYKFKAVSGGDVIFEEERSLSDFDDPVKNQINIGLRMEALVIKNVFIGLEAWAGLKDLEHSEDFTTKENHARLMAGFRF